MRSKKHIDLEFKVRKLLNGDFLGGYKTKFKGNGLEFSDLREYIIGDSVKNIDWKTTAKENKVFIKNYEEERDLNILFFIDIGNSMQFGSEDINKIETILNIFYLLGLSASKLGDNIGSYIFNEKNHLFLNFKKGEENIVRTVNTLQKMIKHNTLDYKENYFLNNLKNLEKLKIKNSLVFILSDNLDFDKGLFRFLSHENEVVYCNIFDHFENNLISEKSINFNLSAINSNTSLNINFGNKNKILDYIKNRKLLLEKFKLDLNKNFVSYLYFDNKTNIVKEFLNYFKVNI